MRKSPSTAQRLTVTWQTEHEKWAAHDLCDVDDDKRERLLSPGPISPPTARLMEGTGDHAR